MISSFGTSTQESVRDKVIISERLAALFRPNVSREESTARYLELIAKSSSDTETPGKSDNSQLLKMLEEKYGRRLVVDCPSAWITGHCECGATYAKTVNCGREWCPECGRRWSKAHQRKFARWWPKVAQMKYVGYLVFTMPREARPRVDEYKPEMLRKQLNTIRKRTIEGLKCMGYERGLCRWHWYGDKSNEWAPHLNIIIDDKWVSSTRLEEFKSIWRKALGLGSDAAVSVKYQFRINTRQVIHTVKYITRATMSKIETYEEGLYAVALYGYRNNVAWGGKERWQGEVYHVLECEDGVVSEVIKLEAGVCPNCGRHLVWSKPKSLDTWENYYMEEVGGGYWLITGVKAVSRRERAKKGR